MALRDYFSSLGIGAAAGLIGAGGIALGMSLSPVFASFVLGLSIAGLSLGGLGLPFVLSAMIAAITVGTTAFALGYVAPSVGKFLSNFFGAAFSWVKGFFSDNGSSKMTLNSDPKKDEQMEEEINNSLKKISKKQKVEPEVKAGNNENEQNKREEPKDPRQADEEEPAPGDDKIPMYI